MQLNIRTFSTIVQQTAAAIQANCAALVNLNPGSVLLSVIEAIAGVGLWLQAMTYNVLLTTRLGTSTGSDIDSYVGDFGLTRSPAVAASGSVLFARYAATIAALIPVGALVKTADGTQTFAVIQDTTNPLWNATLGGYLVPAGTSAATCTVSAQIAGTAGNVQAGTISLLATSIAGVDTVSNPGPFTNGIAAETDTALQVRFINYINTRSQATEQAIAYVIASVQPGLSYTIQENVTPAGQYAPGSFVVVLDDGSGYPPASLLALVSAAINTVRPIGTTYAVLAPTVLTASISLTITAAAGYLKSNLLGPVGIALANYVNALPVGVALPFSRIAQIAYDTSPGVANVTAVTLNSGTADLGGAPAQVIATTTGLVSVN